MKVFISSGLFYPSTLGGPSKTLYWLAKGIAKRRIDVSVVTTNKYIIDKQLAFNKWIDFHGIKVYYCTVKTRINFPVIIHSIKELKKCDVVLLNSVSYIPSFFLCCYSVYKRKITIWSPRGEMFYNAINGRQLKLIYFKLLRFLFAHKIVFHATSEEERKIICSYFGEKCKIVVIPNYMELPEKVTRVDGEKYFLYVGRIAPIKALDKLLVGFFLSENFLKSDYKFFLAGEPEYQFKEYYEKLLTFLKNNPDLQSKVIFLGNVVGTKKNELYANAKFTLLTSYSENFGNVVIESLAQSTPVITSKGTPWKQLEENNSGFWIDNNPEDIATCIDKVLLLSEQEYKQMRINALKFGESFDINKNINKWISIFK